jgi:Na+/H+-dicarboxylate symporter
MQIYTKILIGMAVGATIGLTLGPTSTFLTPDLYKIDDASSIELRTEPGGDVIALPACAEGKGGCIKLRLIKGEQVEGEVRDKAGESHTVTTYTKVEFKVTRRLALRMTEDELKPLGVKAAGETATAWLKMENTPLDSGVLTTPIPISNTGDRIISAISPIGTLFMRLISMVIVPLVFSSLLVGIASLGDIRKLGRMGGKTLGLYLLTTAVAVSIGLACAHVVNPGQFVDKKDQAALQSKFDSKAGEKSKAAASSPSAIDNVLNIVPKNPIDSLSSGNMLQIIFFAVIFGIALTIMGANESKLVVSFFDKIQQAMVVIIHIVMGIAPFGVAALIAEVVGTSGLSVLGALLVYALTVMTGLLAHALFVYGGLVRVFTSISLPTFLKAIRPAQLVAFSTSSSSATLPVSMEVAEQNLRVSNPVASFVLPLGSTVNMDGTALYQGVAAVFIAQVFGIPLSAGDQLGIVLTATMASIGAAGVPGAGMVTLAMVLTASGIPAVGVALILGMDRILDMFRTAVNVTGDLAVTSVMAATEGEILDPLSPEDDAADPDRGFERRLEGDMESVTPD